MTMPQFDELVVGAVALSGGELVGRIRIQKVMYLLEQLGMGGGIPFEYHHYGPYSELISDAITDAKFWGNIEEMVNFRINDGAPYSSFRTRGVAPEKLGQLNAADAKRFLDKFSGCTSTVLELAVTAHWLENVEKVSDWRTEIAVRKAGKTGNGNLDKATEILKEIGLSPCQ
jgi:uncharacterized protein